MKNVDRITNEQELIELWKIHKKLLTGIAKTLKVNEKRLIKLGKKCGYSIRKGH